LRLKKTGWLLPIASMWLGLLWKPKGWTLNPTLIRFPNSG